jgi:hypothetical protein
MAINLPSFTSAAAGFSPSIGDIPSIYVILAHHPKNLFNQDSFLTQMSQYYSKKTVFKLLVRMILFIQKDIY